jgi:hypothetical protein
VIPDKMTRYGLSRFISFCSGQGIVPDAVDVGVFERFRTALMNESFLKQPKPVYRTTCILWNEAAESIRGWPKLQVQVTCEKQQYSFAWDEFPPTLLADREAYIEHLGNEDPFADEYLSPLRPATVAHRRKQIRQTLPSASRSPSSSLFAVAMGVRCSSS